MSKTLVAYFSANGNTERIAKNLAKAAEADLYKITPAVPYTKADLDWMNKKSRSSIEMKDPVSRPELADKNANIEVYDTILLGFPIWWYVAPTIINTFLESYDFAGKKVVLFATSGGSDFGKTVAGLRGSVADNCELIEGKMFLGGFSLEDTKKWLKTVLK